MDIKRSVPEETRFNSGKFKYKLDDPVVYFAILLIAITFFGFWSLMADSTEQYYLYLLEDIKSMQTEISILESLK